MSTIDKFRAAIDDYFHYRWIRRLYSGLIVLCTKLAHHNFSALDDIFKCLVYWGGWKVWTVLPVLISLCLGLLESWNYLCVYPDWVRLFFSQLFVLPVLHSCHVKWLWFKWVLWVLLQWFSSRPLCKRASYVHVCLCVASVDSTSVNGSLFNGARSGKRDS